MKYLKIFDYYKEPTTHKNNFGFEFPEYTYIDHVFDHIIYIIETVNSISEKDYSTYDKIKTYMTKFFDKNPTIVSEIKEHEDDGWRYQYTSEYIYHKYFEIGEELTKLFLK